MDKKLNSPRISEMKSKKPMKTSESSVREYLLLPDVDLMHQNILTTTNLMLRPGKNGELTLSKPQPTMLVLKVPSQCMISA